MFRSKRWTFSVVALVLVMSSATAQRIVPSPLLAIDQNRNTVVERIVGQWGDALYASNAGIGAAELRQMLSGMRSDHLLAASLAGTLDGLRDVMAKALVGAGDGKSSLLRQKSLGDTSDDLVYTPVVPCRILDTRNTSGPLLAGVTRTFIGYNATSFAVQGGVASNCGVPDGVAALSLNIAAVQPVDAGFIRLWPDNAPMPFASVLNYAAGAFATATGTIVPVDGGLNNQFDAWSPAQVDFVADVVGYFQRPSNYGGTHTITGLYATDSGGFQNTASGNESTVAGGLGNTASGIRSTVAGGVGNTASGAFSTVAGGSGNTASGLLSFAAGNRAQATTTGSFIWADFSGFDFGPSVDNFFGVRATGGVGFTVAIDPTTGGVTQFCNLLPGVPSWQCTSDREAKENFVAADGKDILKRLVAMPLFSWNFKGADPAIRSLGPTAQDFYAAFGLGNDNKSIASVNLEGVALAAIQGLYQLLQERDARIAALERSSADVDALRAELATLKAAPPISSNASLAGHE